MRALVLGGGGITGIAWELGLVHGLQRLGTDLARADVIIGLGGDDPHVRRFAASCALPGGFPTVRVGDDHYMDGGVRSVTNADLAAGADAVAEAWA